MRFTITLAAAAMALTASQAFASGHDIYQGDGTQQVNVLVQPYNARNLCPNGLQPVSVGGVICCGTPTAGATAYYNPVGKKKISRKVHRVSKAPRKAPRRTIVEGEKGVVYR